MPDDKIDILNIKFDISDKYQIFN